MISPEGIELLNEILPEIPIDSDFRVSNYVKAKVKADNSKIGSLADIESIMDNLAKEIHFFLIGQVFAVPKGSWVLLRKGVTADMKLTAKGISLKYAGTYEEYYATTNKETREEDNEDVRTNVMQELTAIIALWTFVAGIYYLIEILKYMVPHFCCPCYRKAFICAVSFAVAFLGWKSLKKYLLRL